MRKVAARRVLASVIIVVGCLLTACGQGGAVKQAVSSFTASNSVGVSPSSGSAGPASGHSSASAAVQSSAPATSASSARTSAPTAAPAPAAPAPDVSASSTTASASSTTASASSTAAPAAESSGGLSGWIWLLIALAAVVLAAAATAWLVGVRRRHSATAADWQTQLIDAYARGSALHDAMAAAETPEALGAPDATARWADIQRRADDFGQLLYTLRESARDDQERILIADVLGSLQSARSAMAAERSAGGGDDSMAGVVRDRLSWFGSALRALRRPKVRPAG